MRIRFYIDGSTDLPHFSKHGINEDEVEDVLTHPSEDRPGKEGSRVTIGQTSAGRYVRVVYVPDPEPDSVFVITEYELSEKPLKAFRRRRRAKGTI